MTALKRYTRYGFARKHQETAESRANSIEQFRFQREVMVGNNDRNARYDLFRLIIINISRSSDKNQCSNNLICMLTDLLNKCLSNVEKISALESYGVRMTKELRKEVNNMCTVFAASALEDIKQDAFDAGLNKGIRDGINQALNSTVFLMKSFCSSAHEAYIRISQTPDYRDIDESLIEELWDNN